MPAIFKQISHHAAVTPMQVYGVWWALAALIVAGTLLVRRPTQGGGTPMAALPWRLYVAVPFLSLLVHLCGENRVYAIHFQPANLAPVVLALAVAMNLSAWRKSGAALSLSLTAVALACLVSLVPPEFRTQLTAHAGPFWFSPLRLSLIASAALMTWLAVDQRSLLAAQAAAVCGALATLGSQPPEMVANSTHVVKWSGHTLWRAVPQTPLQWGYLAIAMAFILLGIGALGSLRKPPTAISESPRN
jgi:hypothetical protein